MQHCTELIFDRGSNCQNVQRIQRHRWYHSILRFLTKLLVSIQWFTYIINILILALVSWIKRIWFCKFHLNLFLYKLSTFIIWTRSFFFPFWVYLNLWCSNCIYFCAGVNRYYFMCLNDLLALGGGGNYALCLEEDL